MDIKVRDVAPMYIDELDRRARDLSEKLGRPVSRNAYVKMLIQQDCELRLMEHKMDGFDRAVENLTQTLDRQADTLQQFIDSNSDLIRAIMGVGRRMF